MSFLKQQIMSLHSTEKLLARDQKTVVSHTVMKYLTFHAIINNYEK